MTPPIYSKKDFCGTNITRDSSAAQQKCFILPFDPSDGQIFIDIYRIQWQFDSKLDVWSRIGPVLDLPLADTKTTGLLSKQDKILLDTIPKAGGAFGFIAQPRILKSNTNPEGIIEGNITLLSESLDITCRDGNGQPIADGCGNIKVSDTGNPPAIVFQLSQRFLDTICCESYGPAGPTGFKGDTGDAGLDGFSNSPVGDQGDPGVDATTAANFLGIKIVDIDDVRDSVIVDVELDATTAKLSYTTSKMNVPESDEPADQLIATPVQRSLFYPLLADNPVEYTTLDDWRLSVPPGDPVQDPELLLFKMPSVAQIGDEVSISTVKLSTFIQSIVDFYKKCLADQETKYLQQIHDFISAKDAAARAILAGLAQQVAECEFQRPLSFCLGIEPGECPEGKVEHVVVDNALTINPIDVNIVPSLPPSPAP